MSDDHQEQDAVPTVDPGAAPDPDPAASESGAGEGPVDGGSGPSAETDEPEDVPAEDERGSGKRSMTLGEARAWAEFHKIQADTRLTELSCTRSEIEIERARLEVENLRRREQEAVAAHEELVYTFYDAITSESVKTCMSELASWARRDPTSGIKVVFNSPGGSVMDGLALFDYLRHLSGQGHHITTLAMGRAASMGAVLLQAGDTRIVGRNAFVMIHEVAAGSIGKLWEMEESLGFAKRLESRLLDLLSERSTMTRAQIKRKWSKTDWWLDAEETLALGLADEIQ